MPIHYDIHPGFDLLVYRFEGECTAREYFDLYHSIYLNDNRRHHGMKILMDLSKARFDFDVENLREAIVLMTNNKANGYPRDRVACLSKSSGMEQIKVTLELMMNNQPMDLDVFYNFHDAARWLGLAEQEKEAMLFWQSIPQGKK